MKHVALLFFVLSLTTTNLAADWTTHGPYGGSMPEIVATPPQTLYAPTFSGVFKSTNGGLSWAPTATGLASNVADVVIHPTTPTTLYAATFGGGVFITTDGGNSWHERNNGIEGSMAMEKLAFNSENPNQMLAGTTLDGIFHTLNGGTSWTQIATEFFRVFSVGFGSASTFYAATDTGFFKTTDSGASWVPHNEGLTTTFLQALAVDPTDSENLYVGTSRGTFKSTNGGTSWGNVLPDNFSNNLAIDPTDPSTIYVASSHGVFRSTNGGASWTLRNTGRPNRAVISIAVNPRTPDHIYANAVGLGFYRSTNAGASWSEQNEGFNAHVIYDVAIDQHDPDVVFAVGGGRLIYRSTDGGMNWTGTNQNLGAVHEVVIDHADNEIIHVSTFIGPYRSINRGASWNPSNVSDFTFALSQHPQDSNILLTGTIGQGIYRSTDRGVTWQLSNAGIGDGFQVFSIAHDPTNGDIAYASGQGQNTVYKTTDAGVSWTSKDNGLVGSSFLALGVNPHNSEEVYVGTQVGLMRSMNGGDSWQLTSLVDTFAYPSDPEQLFVSDFFDGVFGSVTSGLTWEPVNMGLGTTRIEGIALTPDASKLYAGSFGSSVFVRETPEITTPSCASDPERLCLLEDRFEVRVDWRTAEGNTGVGRVVPGASDESGNLYFFTPDNWELLIKILDGCSFNDRFWVFFAATTNVEFTVTVRDVLTGLEKQYSNPLGQPANAVTDTDAFDSCS